MMGASAFSTHSFSLSGAALEFTGTGALWWPSERVLAVSDLHLGRSERYARNAGALLPPYEVMDTLERLEAEVSAFNPSEIICLGDSFDDRGAEIGLAPQAQDWVIKLMAGRRWSWILGNHDPGPVRLGGSHMAERRIGPLTFRHIAEPGAAAEISGHYHPKARVGAQGRAKPCLLYDSARAILPAFGTYTGGLAVHDAAFAPLIGPRAIAVLTGSKPMAIPARRKAQPRARS